MLTLHTNPHAVHGRFRLKDDCEGQVWNAGAASWTQREWSEQLSCQWMSDESWCYDTDVHERGTWQLCHVKRLAFPLNISFYLMQHTPLWRSKFWILRIKKTRTKIGTLRISHTSSKLHRDIPSRSFTKTDLSIGAITDKVLWLSWVEHTCVAQVKVSGGLFLFVSVSC